MEMKEQLNDQLRLGQLLTSTWPAMHTDVQVKMRFNPVKGKNLHVNFKKGLPNNMEDIP